MSKFSTVARGTRAEKQQDLPPADGGDGKPVPALVRALNGLEEEQVLALARDRALKQKVRDPKPGDPIYDLALMVETIAASYLDPDSPREARELIFADADEVRGAYGRDAIAYSYDAQQLWQSTVSPTMDKMDAATYVEGLTKLGGPSEEAAMGFWSRLSPGLQLSCARTMAVQLSNSLWDKSPSGGNSASAGPS